MITPLCLSPRRFALLCLSLGVFVLAGCGSASAPDRVVENLFSAIDDHRTDEAASHFSVRHLGQSSQAMQLQEHLFHVLEQAHVQMQQKGGLDAVTITRTQVDNPVAQVEADIKFRNGETYPVSLSMTHEDNRWKAVLHDNNLSNLNLGN